MPLIDNLGRVVYNPSRELSMRGTVETYQKCKVCGLPFVNEKEIKIYCPTCQTIPTRYRIVLYDNKQTYRISTDTDGHLLDSYQRAHRLLEKIRKDIDDKIFSIDRYVKKSVDQFRGYVLFERWYQYKVSQNLSPLHLKKVRTFIDNLYKPSFRDQDCRDLKTNHIDLFFGQLSSSWGDKYKKNIMTMLRNFCHWLFEREIITRIPNFPVISPEEPTIKWIDRETQLAILGKMPLFNKPIFEFLIYHPVRPQEARALKVKDISIENMTVYICRAFSGAELRPRKNKRPYYLPLNNGFDLSLLKDKLPEAFIYTTIEGRPYTHARLTKIWKRACNKAKVEISLYNGTRHSGASQAVNRGIGLDVISKALGHSTLEITKRYASMNINNLRVVIDE